MVRGLCRNGVRQRPRFCESIYSSAIILMASYVQYFRIKRVFVRKEWIFSLIFADHAVGKKEKES
jgi:hypothetical protein